LYRGGHSPFLYSFLLTITIDLLKNRFVRTNYKSSCYKSRELGSLLHVPRCYRSDHSKLDWDEAHRQNRYRERCCSYLDGTVDHGHLWSNDWCHIRRYFGSVKCTCRAAYLTTNIQLAPSEFAKIVSQVDCLRALDPNKPITKATGTVAAQRGMGSIDAAKDMIRRRGPFSLFTGLKYHMCSLAPIIWCRDVH